jgi:hypothetical protein
LRLNQALAIAIAIALSTALACGDGRTAVSVPPVESQDSSSAVVPSPSQTAASSPQPIAECRKLDAPPSSWPKVARAALQELVDRYEKNCVTAADFDFYFSLPDGLTQKQEAETIRWYTDALKAATRAFGDLLGSQKPIAVFYKSSADDMCDDLLSFMQAEGASKAAIASVESMEWACAPTKDWDQVYLNSGYGASILRAQAPNYDYIIVNMGNAQELRSKDPYSQLMPTFQTPSHELFHLAQAANRSQGATLWWAEGGAAYVGHMTAAMQGMVSYSRARSEALVSAACAVINGNAKSGPPAIKALSGWWDQAEGQWWGDMVYPLGALASEYVLGTYGWEKFHSWASGYEGKDRAYLETRSQMTFGISLEELHQDIDQYLKSTVGLGSC